jgi:septal ring factor EnvC (AmiA/AmiB activator)
MATLTATITEALLGAVDDSERLERVLQQNAHSKGPLYLGLAAATTQLRSHLDSVRESVATVERERSRLQNQVDALEQRAGSLEHRVVDLESQASAIEQRLADRRALLDQAETLARQGFGTPELDRLHQLLATIAAGQGAPPEDGVAAFFQVAERYGKTTALELEARRAEARAAKAAAEVERWEA